VCNCLHATEQVCCGINKLSLVAAKNLPGFRARPMFGVLNNGLFTFVNISVKNVNTEARGVLAVYFSAGNGLKYSCFRGHESFHRYRIA